jgi:glycosyltransferase involved in cell wall biosynthesis
VITTIIPVYNGQRFLRATLDSLAAQTRRPDRVVLINDCSSDDTVALAQSHPVIRCEIEHNERNLGLFANHNRALRWAERTEYLHILHANDLIEPDFFRVTEARLLSAPARSLAYCDHRYIPEDGVGSGVPTASAPEAGRITRRQFLAEQSELKAIQLHSALLKTSQQPAPCDFPLDYPQVGDCIFHACWAAQAPEIWHVPAVLSLVRRHHDSVSNRNARSLKAWLVDEWRAMNEISALIEEGASARWLRTCRLRCLLAARAVVKQDMVRRADPEFCAQIGTAVAERISWPYRLAGWLAVRLRDVIKPPQSVAH